MRSTLVLVLAAAAALSGCLSSPSAPAAIAQAPPPAPAEPVAPLAEPEALPPAPEPRTVTLEGVAAQDWHVRAGAHAGMSDAVTLTLPEPSPRNATLVVTWTSRCPLDQVIEAWLLTEEGIEVAHLFGASPLAVEIPGADIGDGLHLSGWVEPSQPGALVDVDVTFTLRATYA